jgi:hypothetical protein
VLGQESPDVMGRDKGCHAVCLCVWIRLGLVIASSRLIITAETEMVNLMIASSLAMCIDLTTSKMGKMHQW